MFGFAIMCYLFLGGLGGGLCIVTAALGLCAPRAVVQDSLSYEYRTIFVSCFMASAVVLVLAAMCLLADGIRFEAIERLFFASKVSFLSVGAWAVAVSVVVNVLLAFAWKTNFAAKSIVAMRGALIVAALVGSVVVLYTGLFLATMRAVPLWNTLWLPVLFALSALSCGVAFAVFIAHIRGFADVFTSTMRNLVWTDMVLIVLEALCVLGFIVSLCMSADATPTAAAAAASAGELVSGEFAWLWWGGFVGLGLLTAMVLDIVFLRPSTALSTRLFATAATTFCVLAGAFSLRVCLVLAGSHPVLGF